MENVLFIGNGINRLQEENSLDWGKLLEKVSSQYHINANLKNPLKPFPLSFDEMTNLKPGNNNFNSKIKNLKKNISKSFFELAKKNNDRWHNDYHSKFMDVDNFNYILTTNYDYAFETSVDANFFAKKRTYAQDNKEVLHSLRRVYKIKEKNIYHVHGELENNRKYDSNNYESYIEESIMIGFAHYASYHKKIMTNINRKNIENEIENKKSIEWPFLFFTNNIHIVGFGFDFSESHLWWLLQKRKAYIHDSIEIKNKIFYYMPKFLVQNRDQLKFKNQDDLNERIKLEINQKKLEAKTEVLNSLGVNIIDIECNTSEKRYFEFYDKVIEKLKRV
jgi:hypothetical protein